MNNLCIRRVDELGRITLPADVRRWLDIKEKDCLEITVDLKEGKIILSKSSARYETNV